MIDVSDIKLHCHGTRAQGGPQEMGRPKGGINTERYVAVDAHGMPVRPLIPSGTTADSIQASRLIEGIEAEHILVDKGQDSDAVVEKATHQGRQTLIPPRKNRKEQRPYDKHLYKWRHVVENAFLHLKRWRGIATRDVKHSSVRMPATA